MDASRFGIRCNYCSNYGDLFWNNHNKQENKNPNKFQLRLRTLPRRFGPFRCANLCIADGAIMIGAEIL